MSYVSTAGELIDAADVRCRSNVNVIQYYYLVGIQYNGIYGPKYHYLGQISIIDDVHLLG
jgi:hypothetical protein